MSLTVTAGDGRAAPPGLSGRSSLDQQRPQQQQQHKRSRTSITSPFTSSTFRDSPGPYSTAKSNSSSSSGGSSPSGSESPKSKMLAFKSLFTRRRADGPSLVSASTNMTALIMAMATTARRVRRLAQQERPKSSVWPHLVVVLVAVFGGRPAWCIDRAQYGYGEWCDGRRGAQRAARGRSVSVSLKNASAGSPSVAKKLDRHISIAGIGSSGTGMCAEKATMVLDPDMDVDCSPPVLASLWTVHENIPVHGCSFLEALYPYSYKEFILQRTSIDLFYFIFSQNICLQRTTHPRVTLDRDGHPRAAVRRPRKCLPSPRGARPGLWPQCVDHRGGQGVETRTILWGLTSSMCPPPAQGVWIDRGAGYAYAVQAGQLVSLF